MALDLGTLTAYLSVDNSAWSGGFEKAKESITTFGGKVPSWMGVATGAIVAGGVAAGAALYGLGDAWDEVIDTIRVGTGATGKHLDDLTDSAKNVARKVPAELSAIGPAVADLNTRLGLTGETLETVAGQVLEASRMLGEDVDIHGVSSAFSAFNLEQDKVAGGMDHLFRVSQATGIGFNDLASRVAAAAPITQQLGFTFEETAGMIGTMDKAGLDSQSMIGAMQKGLAGMTKPGEDASETFNRVVGEIQGFIDKGDDAAARDVAGSLFGTRGAAQFVGALRSGALDMSNLADVAGMTGDTILGAGEDTQDFAEKWQLVQNNAAAALEPLGSAVFGALGDALTAVLPYLTDLGDWMSENPDIMMTVVTVLGILAAGFLVAAAATWVMNSALLANPITWIILAVVALIAAVVALVMNWDSVVAWITEIWDGFIGWIVGVIEDFVAGWEATWAAVGQFISDVWVGFTTWVADTWQGFIDWIVESLLAYALFWVGVWTEVGNFFSDLWSGIVAFVSGVWEGFIGWIRSVIDTWVAWWHQVWSGVFRFISDIWNGIVDVVVGVVTGIIDFVAGLPGAIMDIFVGAGEWLYGIGEDILNGLWDGLLAIWNNLVGWIEDIGQGIADTFAWVLGIQSPSRVFRAFGMNTIQGYIDGVRAMNPDLDRTMTRLAPTPEMASLGGGRGPGVAPAPGAGGEKHFHYHAAENQSLSDEEALFDALSSPRAKGF